jgi:DNA-binding MarR family transcriptional regulator
MPEQFYDAATYAARDSVGYLVRRLYSVMRTRLEATFAHQDFTLMQWIVLVQIRDGLARTASDIARDFAHDSGALTRVIDQLERRGLLVRNRSSVDRRVVDLELTRKGGAVIADLLPLVVAEMNFLLEPLSRQEFDQFRGLLLRVLEHVQQAPLPDRAVPQAAPPARATVRSKAAARGNKGGRR